MMDLYKLIEILDYHKNYTRYVILIYIKEWSDINERKRILELNIQNAYCGRTV